MTVDNDEEAPAQGIVCCRRHDYKPFFDDMFRYILYERNLRQRFFHFTLTGFTVYIGEALLKMMNEDPDYDLQARVREAVADWGWVQDRMEQCRRIGMPILNPYRSLLAVNDAKRYLRFFSKMCEVWMTLLDIGETHLTSQIEFYALYLISGYVSFHPSEYRLQACARRIMEFNHK